MEIHSIGLYGDQRKLLVIIRNYRAALKKKNKQTGILCTELDYKKIKKYQTPNGTDRLVTYTVIQEELTDNLFQV